MKPVIVRTRTWKLVERYYDARDRFAGLDRTMDLSTSLLLRMRREREQLALDDIEPHFRLIVARIAREIRAELRQPERAGQVIALV